jgi:hypothetical protein
VAVINNYEISIQVSFIVRIIKATEMIYLKIKEENLKINL